ncbi:hypothetical protein JCM3770_007152 [Rhodotorula araucariae]
MPRVKGDPQRDRAYSHWLVKAEPETRIEKGIDVKFSIDDLEEKRTTTWEGVRNHEAKKYLKSQMKLGHTCLFYASNCKTPGVTGLARVIKEGYPDYNAWDPKHPYYDPKSKQDDPTWFMVDVEFLAKFPHPVPLALLQHLAFLSATPTDLPSTLAYLSAAHLAAIAGSALITRGRLSVQPVETEMYEAVELLGRRGGWEGWDEWRTKGKAKGAKRAAKTKAEEQDADATAANGARAAGAPEPKSKAKRARASAKARTSARAKAGSEDEEAGASSEEEDTSGGQRRVAGSAEGAHGMTRSSKRLRSGAPT